MYIRRIYLPKPNDNNEYVTYENQLQPRYRFDNERREVLFRSMEDELMKFEEKEIAEYVNCEDLCNIAEGIKGIIKCRRQKLYYMFGEN